MPFLVLDFSNFSSIVSCLPTWLERRNVHDVARHNNWDNKRSCRISFFVFILFLISFHSVSMKVETDTRTVPTSREDKTGPHLSQFTAIRLALPLFRLMVVLVRCSCVALALALAFSFTSLVIFLNSAFLLCRTFIAWMAWTFFALPQLFCAWVDFILLFFISGTCLLYSGGRSWAQRRFLMVHVISYLFTKP